MKLIISHLLRSQLGKVVVIVLVFAVIGVAALQLSRAATPFIFQEAELGTLAGCASKITDPAASGGAAISFGTSCTPASANTAGAHLPITYSLGSLAAGAIYVAPTGNDANAGTVPAPVASLSRAISIAPAGGTIVLRGGTYRGQSGLTIPANKTLKILAYPGEIPVLNGAKAIGSGWTAEGQYSYVPYTPRPVTDGVMSFSTNQGIAGDGVGKYADQAWVGATELKQVADKSGVGDGKFWVDRANNRLYMTTSNVNQGNVEVSGSGRLVYVFAPNTRIEGLRIQRYSDNGGDYGMLLFGTEADNSLVKNVEIIENAYTSLFYDGSGNRNTGSTVENVTIMRTNWMGMSLNGTDNFSLINSKITSLNKWDEFLPDPVTGAIKTARTWDTKIIGNEITDTHGHAVWFDISNYRAIIANNTITGTTYEAVFYEISDDLLLINNYIAGTGGSQPVRLAGSSGIKMVNNTIIGGKDAIGLYTDDRSKPGCAKPGNPPCGPWGDLRDSYHPYLETMDWIPRLDLMINNIVAYPTQTGFCGVLTTMCITQRNSTATVALQTTIHKADSLRPQTVMDGNVYANGNGTLIAVNDPLGRYTTTNGFAAAMAGSPVGIAGFETAGKYGNNFVQPDGTPTGVLSAAHNQAVPVPTNSVMNQYIPAGTRHYGVTSK